MVGPDWKGDIAEPIAAAVAPGASQAEVEEGAIISSYLSSVAKEVCNNEMPTASLHATIIISYIAGLFTGHIRVRSG